jgi:hypothetical protein
MAGNTAVLAPHLSWRYRNLLLLGFAVLVAVRLRAVWPGGRLWAEEAVVYLANAWTEPWYQALVAVHAGYINLPAAAAPLLALHLVPLEYLACVMVVLALLMQLLPAIALLSSGIAWLSDWRVLARALLLVAIPPLATEVWLNTITSQFHVLLAVAVILAAVPGRRSVAVFQGTVLLLAPLCGASSAALFPLFLLRAWIDRSRPRLLQALLLLPGALIQIAVLLTHPEPGRAVGFDPILVMTAIAAKQILLPLLGPIDAGQLSNDLREAIAAGHPPALFLLAPVLFFGALGAAAWCSRDAAVRWLYAGTMLVMLVMYFGALTPGGGSELLILSFGSRYYYVPAVLTSLTVLGVAASTTGAIRALATGLVVWLLVVGMLNYFRGDPITLAGPSWPVEVARWRADPSHPIAVWPLGWAWQVPAEHQ